MTYSTKFSTTSASANNSELVKNKIDLKNQSPLLIPLLFFISGILISRYFITEFYPIPYLIFFLVTSLLFVFFSYFKKALQAQWLIYIIFTFFGFLLYSGQHTLPNNHIDNVLKKVNSIQNTITGTIVSEPIKGSFNFRFILELESISHQRVLGKILFSSNQEGLRVGDKIETLGLIRTFEQSNPGEVNWKKIYKQKGIYGKAFSLKRIIVINHDHLSFIQRVFFQIRKQLKELIVKKFPSDYVFIQAILLGDQSEFVFEEEQKTVQSVSYYQKSGLMHILAVSGFHTSILYFSLMFVFTLVNRRFSNLICFIILFLYAGICLWTPSVTRAMVMINLFILAGFLNRNQSFWQVFSLALFIILSVNTNQLFDIGLQLSCLAIVGIQVFLTLQQNLKEFFGYKSRIGKITWKRVLINALFYLGESLLFSFIICLFTVPILLYHFNTFNLNSLLANPLMIPIFTFLMPLVLLILILPTQYPVFSLLDYTFQFFKMLFEKTLLFSSSLPFIHYLSINSIQLFFMCLFLLGLIILVLHFNKRRIIFLSSLLILCIILTVIFQDKGLKRNEIIIFNTGTSDASLIHTDQNENIVIDTGDLIEKKALIENSMIPFCLKNKINNIDYLILTHPHQDHIGGAKALITKIKVKNLLVTEACLKDSLMKPISILSGKKGINILVVKDTFRINLKSSVLQILHPDKDFISDNPNNLSITTRWTDKKLSVLFTGDIELEAIDYLCKRYPDELDCDVLKLPHHGSQTGASINFFDLMTPEKVIITTAQKNRFNFPHKKMIELLKIREIPFHITGKDGAYILEY